MPFERPFWVRFDVDDRQQPAPAFCLPRSGAAGAVCLDDYRARSALAVFFAPVGSCTTCEDLFTSLDDRAEAYRAEGAQVLAVLPPGSLENTGAGYASFPVLADENGAVRAKYAGLMAAELVEDSDALLFVLDEFGAPYAVLVGAERAAGERLHDEVLSWLQFISLQCPE